MELAWQIFQEVNQLWSKSHKILGNYDHYADLSCLEADEAFFILVQGLKEIVVEAKKMRQDQVLTVRLPE